MHKILTKQGYVIDKSKITKRKLTQIKKELTVKPYVHPDFATDIEPFKLFKENETHLSMPRFYAIKHFGSPIREVSMEGVKIKTKFKGELRPKQLPIVEKTIKHLSECGGGILSLHCGFGKTVLALNIACQLGVKTLVIVHKTFLQNQWYDRIKQFTNARVGLIRQKKVEIRRKDIVVGMLQSIAMIDYSQDLFDEFGCIIVDECHHSPSRVFSRALIKTGGQYIIGLSATPRRADGLTRVLHWYLGDIICDIKRKGDNRVIVKAFNYESTDPLFAEKRRYFNGRLVLNNPIMINNICNIKARNQFIIKILDNLRKRDGRKILVLGDRIKHLETLKEEMDKILKNEIDDNVLIEGECTTAFYIGRMKQYELEEAEDATIIFASNGMAKEGLDIPGLNALLLITGKKNIVQSIGRIMRKPIKDGDIYPMIIDIMDQLSIFQKWSDTRRKYYEKCKYRINFYQVWNEECVSMRDYLIRKKIIKQDQEVDVRKEYLCYKYGENVYKIEEKTGFVDEEMEKYTYDPSLDSIFRVNYDE